MTLDPHVMAEGATLGLTQQIYEPLVQRDASGKMLPALAESWTLGSDRLTWDFRLRAGVQFHDGKPFSADDVVFSIERARQKHAGFGAALASIERVAKVDDTLVRIKTQVPNPLLPAHLTNVAMMSKAWTEAVKATQVAAPEARSAAPADKMANGTGPFVLVAREPGVRTVMSRNNGYWGLKTPALQNGIEVGQLIYLAIRNDSQRVQALTSGEVDFVQDVPVNELQRLQSLPGFQVSVGPENRSIFLAMNVGEQPLASSSEKERNPFADKRVRQALNIAINRQAIQKAVTLGQSIPTGVIAPPSVNGYSRELDRIPAVDATKAKALIAEAGFPNGFSVKLDCPIDRWVRDEAICRALAAQLAPIGIAIEIANHPRAEHQSIVRATPPRTDFYLMGWAASTFDSQSIFAGLFQSRTDKTGLANATRFSNAEVDKLTGELATQTDFTRRNQIISQLWRTVHDEQIYIPLHIQTVAYAMKAAVEIAPDIENLPKLKLAKFKRTL